MAISYRFIGDINKGKTLIGEANRQLYLLRREMEFQNLKQLRRGPIHTPVGTITCVSSFGMDVVYINVPLEKKPERPVAVKKWIIKRPVFLIGIGTYVRQEVGEGGKYDYDPERFDPERLLLFDPKIEAYGFEGDTIFTGISPEEARDEWDIDLFYPTVIEETIIDTPRGMLLREEREYNPGANFPLVRWLNASSSYTADIYRFRYSIAAVSGEEFDAEYPNCAALAEPTENSTVTASDPVDTHCDYETESTRLRSYYYYPHPPGEEGRDVLDRVDDYRKGAGRRLGGSTSLQTQTDYNSSFGWMQTIETSYHAIGSDHGYYATAETATHPFRSWYENYYTRHKTSCVYGELVTVDIHIGTYTFWYGYPSTGWPRHGEEEGTAEPYMLGGANGGCFTLQLAKTDYGHITIGLAMAGSMLSGYPVIDIGPSGATHDTEAEALPAERGQIATWNLHVNNAASHDLFGYVERVNFNTAVTKLVSDYYTEIFDEYTYVTDHVLEGRVILQEIEVTEYSDGQKDYEFVRYTRLDKMHFIYNT